MHAYRLLTLALFVPMIACAANANENAPNEQAFIAAQSVEVACKGGHVEASCYGSGALECNTLSAADVALTVRFTVSRNADDVSVTNVEAVDPTIIVKSPSGAVSSERPVVLHTLFPSAKADGKAVLATPVNDTRGTKGELTATRKDGELQVHYASEVVETSRKAAGPGNEPIELTKHQEWSCDFAL